MYERMLNKSENPTVKNMTAYCGETARMFSELNEWISREYGTMQAIVFPYGNSYGWAFLIREKAISSATCSRKTTHLLSC